MISPTDPLYLREIEDVFILESIEEIFDNVSALMSPNSVLYGSTVTSLLSGLPILGDLDISVPKSEETSLLVEFASSTKWIQVEGSPVPERHGDNCRVWCKSITPSYGKDIDLPISNVNSFQNINDARVQVITSAKKTKDPFEDALNVVRDVDFVFCAMVMNRDGHVFETIPGAYEDCLRRVIRISNYSNTKSWKAMHHRISKYVKRGWGLTFSLDKARENFERNKEKKKPVEPADALIQIVLKDGSTKIIAHKALIQPLSGRAILREEIAREVYKYCGYKIQEGCLETGDRLIWDLPGHVHKKYYKVLHSRIMGRLRSRYHVPRDDILIGAYEKLQKQPYQSQYFNEHTLGYSTTWSSSSTTFSTMNSASDVDF